MISLEEKEYRRKFKEVTEIRKRASKRLREEYPTKEALIRKANSYGRISTSFTHEDTKSELILYILDQMYPYPTIGRKEFYGNLPKYLTG